MAFKEFVAAIKSLRQAATMPDGERAKAAATARAGLSEWNAEVVIPKMVKELETGSLDMQRSAISALRAAGLDAVEAVPALVAYVDRTEGPKNSDTQNYARKEANYAIEEIMRLSQQLLEREEQRQREINREDERKAMRRAQEARRIVQTPEEANEPPELRLADLLRTQEDLIAATRDRASEVRITAIQALVNLNRPYQTIAPVIRERLDDEDERVRVIAAQALGQLKLH